MAALGTFAIGAGAFYLLLVVIVYFYQSRLVYFPNMPSRALAATPVDIGLAFEDVTLRTADGVTLHGWFVPPARADAAVVLFCHGNAGNISHRLEWLALLHELGLGVLLFDYRGYGRSEGAPDEQGTYRDAAAAWAHLTGPRAIPAGRIIVFGESLGGAIAAHLAREVRPAALVLTSTFTSVPDLAGAHYWYLPVRLLSRFEYRTVDYVAGLRAPLLVMHSRDDEIVPFEHGRRILERAPGPRQLIELSGDHNSGFIVSATTLEQGLRAFLAEHALD